MDNFTFGMFSEMDDYDAREEFLQQFEETEDWVDEFEDDYDGYVGADAPDDEDDYAADYYGEQDFG